MKGFGFAAGKENRAKKKKKEKRKKEIRLWQKGKSGVNKIDDEIYNVLVARETIMVKEKERKKERKKEDNLLINEETRERGTNKMRTSI